MIRDHDLDNLNGYGYGHLAPLCGPCGPRNGWTPPDDPVPTITCPYCEGKMYPYAGIDGWDWECAECEFVCNDD